MLEPLSQGTPQRILALFVLTLLPYSLISPWLGVFVDRWDRRLLLVWTSIVRCAALVTLPLWAPLWPGAGGLFVAVLLVLGLGRLFLTTKGAVLPTLVGEHDLIAGNAASGGGGLVSALAGAIVGIGLAGVLEPAIAVACAGVLYAPAIIAARAVTLPHHPTRHVRQSLAAALARVGRGLRDGLTLICRTRRARLALTSIFLLRTVGVFVAIAAVLIIKQRFPAAGDRVGRLSSGALALGAAGIGALLGALVAPLLGRRFDEVHLVLIGYAISGGSLITLGSVIGISTLLILMLAGGMGGFIAKVAVDALVQQSLPDGYRGRAFALYDIIYNFASIAAGALVVAFVATPPNRLLVAAGVATLLVAASLYAAMRRTRVIA